MCIGCNLFIFLTFEYLQGFPCWVDNPTPMDSHTAVTRLNRLIRNKKEDNGKLGGWYGSGGAQDEKEEGEGEYDQNRL